MTTSWSRRELLATLGSAAAASAALPRTVVGAEAPARLEPPCALSTANLHRVRNGGPFTGIETCLEHLRAGEDPLVAAVSGIEIVELDPEDTSVGYGGLPNAQGVVELDASVMHGAKPRAGGVAALQGVRNPARVALAVADQTDHHLLVGEGARAFARQMGFPIEDDLNTPTSRRLWLEWRRRIDPEHWLDPERQAAAAERARESMIADALLDPLHAQGTCHLAALDARGTLAAGTSTSGLAWKIPGRVGDSPILGAGLYVDGAVGTAGSTGRGEANLEGLNSFWIVEEMRRGSHPKDAVMAALRRVAERNSAARLRLPDGRPTFSLQFYALDRSGRFAGGSLYHDFKGSIARFAVADAAGARLLECDALYERRGPDPS